MAGKLVLQIKEKEWILIGSDIIVTIERIQGNRTSVSVSAPEDVKILRGTLIEKDRINGA
jgi:carbon storage regulator